MIPKAPILYLSYDALNKEAENLPPTVATFIPLIQRTNIVARVLKAYTNPNPVLPAITENGWIYDPETDTT